MATPSPQELEGVLGALLSADNDVRNQAERTIKDYVRSPASVEPLLAMLGTSQHASVRQMAAHFLRKRICSHWPLLSPASHPIIKAQLLQLLASEVVRPVRRATCAVVAMLAKLLLKVEESQVTMHDGELVIGGPSVMHTWPELMHYLGQASAAPDASHRETAMLLFFYLGESCALRLREHFTVVTRIFDATLKDHESIAVRVMSLKAVGRLVEFLADEEKQVLQFRPLFPAMLQVLAQCIAAEDVQTTILMLDVFASLVDAPTPFVDPYITELIAIVTMITSTPTVTKSLRDAALLILNALARSRPKALVRLGKCGEIVRLVLNALALPWDVEESDACDGTDDTERDAIAGPPTHRIAQSVFDRISIHLPSAQIIGPVIAICSEAITSPQPHVRAMAPLALGITAEGCAEALSSQVPNVLPALLNLFTDTNNDVRHCACFCIGQWVEHMEDALTPHHATIIPNAFTLLHAVSPPNAPVADVQRGALYVLECFSERLPADTLAPYLDSLMDVIIKILQDSSGLVSTAIKSMALCVASTAAINVEERFVPYFQRMVPGLKMLMSISNPNELLLRSKATQAMGQMTVAVGYEHFAEHLNESMHRAQEGLQLNDVTLDENTYIFFANMAQVTGNKFAVQVPTLAPAMIDVACSEDGLQTKAIAGLETPTSPYRDADDDEDDLEATRTRLTVREAELDKKVAAVRCLGAMAKFCSAAFRPFLPQTITAFEGLMAYPHEAMRLVVMETMTLCNDCIYTCFPLPHAWTKGLTAAQPTSNPDAIQYVERLELEAVRSVMRDPSKKVAASSCELLQGICEKWGPLALVQYHRHILQIMLLLLKEKTPCQDTEYDYGEEDEEEEIILDHDNILVDAVADLIGVLARTCGKSFGPLFLPLAEPLFTFCEARRPQNDRAMAVGAFAEVIDEIDDASTAVLVPHLLPVLFDCMSAGNYNMRRNAVFCSGILASHAVSQVAPHVLQLLTALVPHLTKQPEENWAIVDNTASALCRIAMSAAPGSVPLDQILTHVLDAMPLRDDPSENAPVYKFIFGLLDAPPAYVGAQLPQIIVKFARALMQPDDFLDGEIKTGIVGRASAVIAQVRAAGNFDKLISLLTPEEGSMLQRCGVLTG